MRATEHDRPSPDALLQQANRDARGHLKIFLGAAPGVGKTYEMLTQARQRKRDGADVVIGVVETHGRIDTESQIKGFEVIPKKRIPYRGQVLFEMDIDAILQRRPALVLVDELAHTNAEGSRHPKRYLDVEELLSAGIDVYSTLNIQHIDSLNDVVAQITHVQVRETVPDHILEAAAEIELVDTTADDLMKRLREGKVYGKEESERALKNFFTAGNLTALRELALRKAAQRVDRDMVSYMQAHAIGGPWAASEHVLVCIDASPTCAELVRRGRRLADSLKANWTVLHVESAVGLSETDKDRIADTMRLAKRSGAEAVTIPGRAIAQTILEYARSKNITQILIGRRERPIWLELLQGSVARDLMRAGGAISVTSVLAQGDIIAPKRVRTAGRAVPSGWAQYVWSGVSVLATGVIAWAFNATAPNAIASIGMLFLVPVLLSAVSFGFRPAIATALASVLAYNFFFLPPLYTFTIADPNNWLSFGVLLFVAVVGGNLAARVKAQADLATARAAIAGELYSFTGKLAGIARLDDILWASCFQIASMLKANTVILIPGNDGALEIRSGYPPEDELSADDLAAATWCWRKGEATGRNAETLPGAKRLFLPMRTGGGLVGVIGIQQQKESALTPDERRLLDALSDQTALAFERAQLVEKVDEAQVRAEADKLRVAMLASLSHDLRTPLASILGAATALIASRGHFDETQTDELLLTIREESERLDRFVGNLLDMSRLEAGAVGAKREAVDLADVVATALERMDRRLAAHRAEVRLEPNLPFVSADPLLLEQAMVNLLDNAVKYAPEKTTIRIVGQHSGDRIMLTVCDQGPGISPDAMPYIFDKFYRARRTDRQVAGTGLGLSVARGFVEAFGATLNAANGPDGGAAFTITLAAAA